MIWTETAQVWTFGGRRYLNKYACIHAYCIERMVERYADGYDNEGQCRLELQEGWAEDDCRVLERYYQYCLSAIRANGAELPKLCEHGLPIGCCAVCIVERAAAQDGMGV